MIAEIVARLIDQVPALKQIGGAAEFQAAAESNPTATPAAFVFPLRESGGASPIYGRVRQKVSASVGVVLVVRNVADAKGAAAGGDMATLRAAVESVLLGWVPVSGRDPLEFESGALLAFRNGHMWWQDAYRTQFSKSTA